MIGSVKNNGNPISWLEIGYSTLHFLAAMLTGNYHVIFIYFPIIMGCN